MSDSPVDSDYQSDINNPEFDAQGQNTIRAISSASQALQIATRFIQNDAGRDIIRARVLSAFNGAAPYSDAELKAKGQSYRFNVSFGFLEGVIGRGVVPYNDLTLNVDNLAEVETDLDSNKEVIIQEEFARVIKDWGKWPKVASLLNQDLVLNGYDTLIFPHVYNPFPVFIPQKQAFVHEGALNEISDLDVFVWKKDYLLYEMYKAIRNPEAAKKAGWNVENVKKALMSAAPKDMWRTSNPNGSGNWLLLEQQIRAGALYTSMVGSKMVETFHVFAKELTGKVTHYIVLNQTAGGNIDDTANVDVELFKKEDRWDSFRDMLVYFDMETGDGTWHGSRGLGRRAFNTHKNLDKLRCGLLDQQGMTGNVIIQPGDQASQEDFQLAVFGPFTVIPPGITVSNTSFPAISTTALQVDSLLSATSEQRIGDVVPSTQSQVTGEAKTATEARISATRQLAISRGNLLRFLDPLSQTLSIMLRRLCKQNSPDEFAQRFQKRCVARGIQSEDFAKIKGARSAGRIDDVLGETKANTGVVWGEFRGDPEIDQIKLRRKRITSLLDAKEADDLILSAQEKTGQIESARLQEMEISSMMDGFPVPVSPRDQHPIHAQIGMDWLDGQIQAHTQGAGTPADIMFLVVQHVAGHLQAMSQDKMLAAAAKQLMGDLKGIQKDIAAIQKQEAKAQQDAVAAATQPGTTVEPPPPNNLQT